MSREESKQGLEVFEGLDNQHDHKPSTCPLDHQEHWHTVVTMSSPICGIQLGTSLHEVDLLHKSLQPAEDMPVFYNRHRQCNNDLAQDVGGQ